MMILHGKGGSMPALGLGTVGLKGPTGVAAIRQALDVGYRHIDTAQRYDTESEVGEALATSGVPREDVFVTTKIWPTDLAPETIPMAVGASLRRLRSDYVDLLLVHWPNPAFPLGAVLDAFMGAKRKGAARHVGLSNFPVGLLREAVDHYGYDAFVNQVEYHPFLDQSKLMTALAARGILMTGYMPFARGAVHDHPVLRRIGEAHGRSPSQIVLRWVIEQNVATIPRSTRAENIAANAKIFDFALTASEKAAIDAMRGLTRLANPVWAPDWSLE